MPELPEVETVKETLKNLILNKKIRDIDVFYDGIIKDISVKQFKEYLVDKTFKDIKRVGKYLIFILDDIALISHLRMEGKYFIKSTLEDRVKHEHIIFYFTDGSTLRYHDTRKFGTMDIRSLSDIYTTAPINKLGPEPFDDELSINYLKTKLKNKSIPIKSALLDQTIITGLGNIYVDEVLFRCKLNPITKSNTLKNNDLSNIIKYSSIVLDKAIKLGGTTIRSYTSSLGVTGRFQNELNVHTLENEPCKICQTPIIKTKVNGRGTYFCPKCQK
ncbi:DNA-formamidopyrimidine glycosylase [Candidatus Izimaplasma bacterium ZiA1]|nr:DNA-formamidopyrimidine glycosylase [Candidatus Izimaplasma bacterium ZiA1]